jgi:hypothetical protein
MQNSPVRDDLRDVFNIAFKIGKALKRKFEASDMTPHLRQAAALYAANYQVREGDDFMRDMQNRVAIPGFLTDGQSKGVLNVLMADARRRLANRVPVPAAAAPQTHVTLANVPDGRYRVTLPGGDHLALRITLAGKDSKLFGSRVIGTRINGDEWMGVAHLAPQGDLRLWRSCGGELRDRVRAAINVLDAAERQEDWLVAGLAFAQDGSQCFICGRDLDTPESLTAGYGPVCADKHGLPWGAKAIPMSVRLAQATAAPAPTVAPTSEPVFVGNPNDDAADDAAWEDYRAAVQVAKEKEKEADPAIAHYEYQQRTLAQARAEGRTRTYEEIFGDD